MIKLSEFAKNQPHTAYSAFCHGEVHKFPILLQAIITDQDRVLYSLPVKHRGLGIPILYEISEIHYEHSKSISAPLSSVIIMQGSQIPESKIINEIKYSKKKESDVLLKEKNTYHQSEN